MGPFGNMFGGKTPEEIERERLLAMQTGVSYDDDTQGLPQGGLLAPQQAGPHSMGGLLGSQQPEERSFMAGTGKFGWKDGLSMLLSSVADAGLRNRGYDSDFSGEIFDTRNKAMQLAQKKAEEQAAFAQQMAIAQRAFPGMNGGQQEAIVSGLGNPSDFAPPKRKGLRPVAGPDGVHVWDGDNEQFVAPPGGAAPVGGADEWEDIDEEEAMRLQGGPGGYRPGNFRRR